jgi:hypothetical protein
MAHGIFFRFIEPIFFWMSRAHMERKKLQEEPIMRTVPSRVRRASRLTAVLLTVCLWIVVPAFSQATWNWVTFDAPAGDSPSVRSINSTGIVAGFYYQGGVYKGFVRGTTGNSRTFEVGTWVTWPNRINNQGALAGTYRDKDNFTAPAFITDPTQLGRYHHS